MRTRLAFWGVAFVTAVHLTAGCCRHSAPQKSMPLEEPFWLRGIKLTASDKPGTFLGLRNLLLSFHSIEQRWPSSPGELKTFANTNQITFRPKDYPALTLSPESGTDSLRYSYRKLKWTVEDVLGPDDRPTTNGVVAPREAPRGTGRE